MTIAEYTVKMQELTIAAFHTGLFLLCVCAPIIIAVLAYKDYRSCENRERKP